MSAKSYSSSPLRMDFKGHEQRSIPTFHYSSTDFFVEGKMSLANCDNSKGGK